MLQAHNALQMRVCVASNATRYTAILTQTLTVYGAHMNDIAFAILEGLDVVEFEKYWIIVDSYVHIGYHSIDSFGLNLLPTQSLILDPDEVKAIAVSYDSLTPLICFWTNEQYDEAPMRKTYFTSVDPDPQNSYTLETYSNDEETSQALIVGRRIYKDALDY